MVKKIQDQDDNSLINFSNVLKSISERKEKENLEMATKLRDEDLLCVNAIYVKDLDNLLCMALIECKLTGKSCVCSYMSNSQCIVVMNQNYTCCPGYYIFNKNKEE